jgi:hypothetical protein
VLTHGESVEPWSTNTEFTDLHMSDTALAPRVLGVFNLVDKVFYFQVPPYT